MGCHLRFGFEAQCGRDTLALRDDNIADYPWLCFALAGVMREYERRVSGTGTGTGNRYAAPGALLPAPGIDRLEEAMLNGLTADARAFIGVPPPSLAGSESDRVTFADGFARHKPALLERFERYRPSDTRVFAALALFQLHTQRRQGHGG